jgi:hypothetical protein
MRLPKTPVAAVTLSVCCLTAASTASAQDARGFVGAAVSSNISHDHYAGVGGGVTIDLGTPWISAGGQGEALVSWPYFAGRGALFAQGNLAHTARFRPFVLGGYGFGEDAGPLVGGGVELREPQTRYGFRISVEDYVVRYDAAYESYVAGHPVTRTGHQVAIRASLLF